MEDFENSIPPLPPKRKSTFGQTDYIPEEQKESATGTDSDSSVPAESSLTETEQESLLANLKDNLKKAPNSVNIKLGITDRTKSLSAPLFGQFIDPYTISTAHIFKQTKQQVSLEKTEAEIIEAENQSEE